MVTALMYPVWLNPAASSALARCCLIGFHLAQWQPLALLRDEVPVHTLIGIERESRFAALTVIERGEKALRAVGHERRRWDAVRMDMVGVAIARA